MSLAEQTPAKWSDYAVAVVAFLAPPVAVFSSKAMTPLFLLAAVILILSQVISAPGRRFGAVLAACAWPVYLWLTAAALLTWGVLSALWSIAPQDSLARAGTLFAVFTLGLLGMGAARRGIAWGVRLVAWAFLAGTAVALALYLVEALSNNWLTRTALGLEAIALPRGEIAYVPAGREITDPHTAMVNVSALVKNGTDILALLVWPAVLLLARRATWMWVVLVLAVLAVVLKFGGVATLLALVAGGVVAALAAWRARIAGTVMVVAFVGLFMAMPLAVKSSLQSTHMNELALKLADNGVPNSVIARLFIWKFTADKILERPVMGWGLDASRSIPGGRESYEIRGPAGVLFKEQYLPLHPHNMVLQLWLELGVVGAAIVAVGLSLLFWRLSTPGGGIPGVMSMGLAATATTIAMFSFGVWQSWWLATLFLAAMFLVLFERSEESAFFTRD